MATSGLFTKRDTSEISYSKVQPLIKWTYTWMFVGLVITSIIAGFTDTTTFLLRNPGVLIGAFIGEFALVIALSWAINRLSATVAALMFVVYAALNGLTLSLIVHAYTGASVTMAFVSTAGIFGVLSVFAFTTKVDLLQFRSYFMVAVIGLLIALVVNMFLHSSTLDLLISFAGVLIFVGLTAYDTQKLKYMAASPQFQEDGSAVAKYSIFGALRLYLDFVNLFIFLLRIMGRRR
ncbi:MAG: Bax inhibitor-1/YccA family protein [Chloroflexota bacterium]